MSHRLLTAVRLPVVLALGFGLGAWYGSERTLRRIRFFSAPANRAAFDRRERRRPVKRPRRRRL